MPEPAPLVGAAPGDAPDEASPAPSSGSLRALDWVNFFAADVQLAVGPFVATYLSSRGWRQDAVGSVLGVAALVGVVCQAPAGALVDWTRHRRTVLAFALVALSVGSLLFAWQPTFWPVLTAQIIHGLVGNLLSAAVAAISLGLVGYARLGARNGRNHLFDSAGNVFAAVLMGWVGWAFSNQAIFFVAAALSVPALAALRFIRPQEIDYARARGALAVAPPAVAGGNGADPGPAASGRGARPEPTVLVQGVWSSLLGNRRLCWFAACVVLFHCANAAMLPLLAEMLTRNLAASHGSAEQAAREAPAYMAACVVITQLVIAGLAAPVGRAADRWGRKPLLLLGFGALPLRGLLYVCTGQPGWLLAIQVLDGVAAVVYFVVGLLVVADLTRGSGHFNLAQGTMIAAAGMGAAVSNAGAGWIVQHHGFAAGFLALAAVAAVATTLLWLTVPETRGTSALTDPAHPGAPGLRPAAPRGYAAD